MNENAQRYSESLLTPTQEETLTVIEEILKEQGYCPTMQELADKLGVAKKTAYERVNILVRKKYLKKEPGRALSLVILKNVSNENNVEGDNESNI